MLFRFQLDKNEADAASFMIARIRESYENKRTVWYDSFQKATNGNFGNLFNLLFFKVFPIEFFYFIFIKFYLGFAHFLYSSKPVIGHFILSQEIGYISAPF